MTNKELLNAMSVIADALVGNEKAYQIFTKCMADIDILETTGKIYNLYTNTWY